jgi:hypothetical protein
MPITATRLFDHPIIRPHMGRRMGDNINGPALVRMPDWAQGRLGCYHLYFSDHKGSYIRLAYADALAGPWRMHEPGVLDVAQSLFDATDPPEPAPEDRPAWAGGMKGGYLYAHIASPDIHIDQEKRIFRMYYHGLLWNGDQQTRLAVSDDGLHFTPLEPLFGPPYFRAFTYRGYIHAITWGGELWRAPAWEGPFTKGRRWSISTPRAASARGFAMARCIAWARCCICSTPAWATGPSGYCTLPSISTVTGWVGGPRTR